MRKKKCKGCLAAVTDGHPLSGEPYGCSLGYEVSNGETVEICPKPKTWKKLNRLKRN